jgi:hypothetical protein
MCGKVERAGTSMYSVLVFVETLLITGRKKHLDGAYYIFRSVCIEMGVVLLLDRTSFLYGWPLLVLVLMILISIYIL